MSAQFQQIQLSNGLTVIAEPNPEAHSFAAGFYVLTGSRDESAGINGVSHFLEHMMFKGSTKYGWEDVNRIFDEMGASYNAYTNEETTAYFANVLPEFTEPLIEHLSHLMRPALRMQDFATEKKVILEEIEMYLDDPGHRLYEALAAAHFGRHPLGRSVLGTARAIRKLTRDEMAGYFSRRYTPENMVLAAAGKVEFAQMVKWAQRYCGAWPTGAFRRRCATPPVFRPVAKKLVDKKLNRHYVMGLLPGPSAQDDRRFAARVLSDVLGDSDGSRFYWALVDNAIAEEAEFGYSPHDECGTYYVSLVTDPNRAQKAIKIARREMKRIASDLNEDEVERARNKIASGIVLEGELPMGRMRAIAGEWMYNRAYRSLEEDLELLKGISTESIRRLLMAFPLGKMTTVTLGPG